MEGLGAAASVIAVIDLSAKIAQTCSQYIKEVKNVENDVKRLQEETNNLHAILEDVGQLLEGPESTRLKSSQKLENALKESLANLQFLMRKLESLEQKLHSGGTRYRIKSRMGLTALKWPFSSKEMEKAIREIVQLRETLSLALQHDHLVVSLNSSQLFILGQLAVAHGASFNSRDEEFNPLCLKNTRVELLDQILTWVHDSNSKTIFWLNGMAGTGKSTISRTIARSLSGTGNLGASFFFKRGEADRGNTSKLITTLARQIVDTEPRVSPMLVNAIDSDSTILVSAMQEQFHKLIFEPLSKISLDTPFVFVLDALDECEGNDEVRAIINLFARMQSLQSARLKVFITSRPDLPIRLGFSDIENTYNDLILHQIQPQIIERDISIFLEHSFQSIREDYNRTVRESRRLPLDWPGQPRIITLVSITTPLFISAATVCRFISDRRCGNPDKLLEDFLGHQNMGMNSGLSATYLPILQRQIDGLPKEQTHNIVSQFQYIVGTIVILASPLSASSLAKLLDVLEDDVETRLDMLHSVLHIPSLQTDPIRLLHLSFRDYLLAPETRKETALAIDEEQVHRNTLVNCLRILKTELRENICDVKSPATSRSEISQQLIANRIPPELEYACLYWVEHFKMGGMQSSDSEEVLSVLSSHLLQWMEVLSLLGRASETIKILRALCSLPKIRKEEALLSLLDDAIRFTLTYMHAIDSYPLQIYMIIAFLPTKSIIRSTFSGVIPTWLSIHGNIAPNWDSCLQILEGHHNPIHEIFISPDSKRLASVSPDDSIRLWNTDNGQCLWALPNDSETMRSIQFSPDMKLLATASLSGVIQLWDIGTGQCIQKSKRERGMVELFVFSPDSERIVTGSGGDDLQFWDLGTDQVSERFLDNENGLRSIVFSPNSKYLASLSGNGSFELWDANECEHLYVLEEYGIESIIFSPDSKYLASHTKYSPYGSHHDFVHLWNPETGQCLKILEEQESLIRLMLFSPDSEFLAWTSTDTTVRLWDTKTGQCLQTLGDHGDIVKSIDFSPDAKHLVSAAAFTIRIWDIETGQCLQTIGGHGYWVESVLFSPDSKFFASCSMDKTVRIWGTEAYQDRGLQEDYASQVLYTMLSPDLKYLASSSADHTVRVWSLEAGQYLQTLELDEYSIDFMGFSPDSKRIIVTSMNIVQLWDAETGLCIQTLTGHTTDQTAVAVSINSKFIASACYDFIIRLWDFETSKCLKVLEGHTDTVMDLFFSSNSKLLASVSMYMTVRLWDTFTGKCVQLSERNTNSNTPIIFSSDSKLLASASIDNTARLWDTFTGKCLQKLQHESEVTSIVFLPDEQCLVSACGQGTIHLWHVKTGSSLQILHVDVGFGKMSYSPENSQLQIYAGTITIGNRQSPYPSFKTLPGVDYPKLSGCGVDLDLCWVLWNGHKKLWLPPSLRPESLDAVVVLGSRVVIGTVSGRVIDISMSEH